MSEAREMPSIPESVRASVRSWSWVFAALILSIVPCESAAAASDVWTSHGPQGGTVSVVVSHPAMPNTLYAGTQGGGLRKTTDGGTTWSPANTGLIAAFVGALAIAPSAPETLFVWVGGPGGSGIFKSTDGGGTWDDPAETDLPSGFDCDLAIHPSDSNIIYSAYGGAEVFKTTDGGASWLAMNVGLAGEYARDLAIDPTTPNTVYVASSGGAAAGVFKSVNGGGSWTRTNLTSSYIFSLAIDPNAPTTLYAATLGGVLKTADGGETWLGTGLGGNVQALAIDPSTGTLYASWYLGPVFKSADGGETWEVTGLSLSRSWALSLAINPTVPGVVYAGTYRDGMFKSADGGATWNPANTGFNATDVRALAIGLAVPDVVYAAASEGLFRSTDGGATWTRRNPEFNIQAIAVDPTATDTVYMSSYGGGLSKTTDGGLSWIPLDDPVERQGVLSFAIDQTSPSTIYAGTQSGGVFKSLDGGAAWAPINNGQTGFNVKALAIDRAQPQTIYAGTHIGVFKTTDGGTGWQPASSGLGNNYVVALAIDPVNPGTIYAGTEGSGVFKSINGGASWASANVGLMNLRVGAIAADPQIASTLYAGTTFGSGGGVFMSTDGGASWTPLNTGLNSTFINALAIDPATGTLYAGTGGAGVARLGEASAAGESVSVTVGAGTSCSTDTDGPSGTPDGTTAADPIETTIITPNAGLCAIDERPATASSAPGFRLVGYDVTLAAPPASSANQPLQIVFDLHPSVIPAGQTVYSLQLLKNDDPVGSCDPGTTGQASPDPCLRRVRLPNGGARLIVYTTTASVWSPVVATLDSYLCYGTAATKGAPAPAPAPGHLFTDAFGTTRVDLGKPGHLCLPAARDGAAITDGTTALQAAAVKAGKVCSDTGLACTKKPDCAAPATCGKQPKFAARTGLAVFNALGPLVVDATKPTAALLPSAVVANPPEGVPNPDLDPFTCYGVKPRTKVCVGDPTRACADDTACGDAGPCFAAFPKDLTVRLDEPTATPSGKVFAVKKPTKLCLPAELDGRPRTVPSVALQCYALAAVKKQCANTATTNAGASCKLEEDCGGQKNATSFCKPQAKHAPAVALPVTGSVLGALTRDTKKELEVCVPSEAGS